MADPIQRPQARPAGDAPSGAVSAEVKCCAEVATFEGSPAASKVYGLDPKTCLAPSDADTYWASGSVSGSVPSDRMTRDGARWASVGVGMETELEISFDDASAAGCIANSTFHMEPAHIASIETATVSSKRAIFHIKGQTEGDATLVVRCNGVDKGWFHVACLTQQIVTIETGSVITRRTKSVSYDVAAMKAYFDKVYRQAIIKIDIVDLGDIDLRGHPEIATLDMAEGLYYDPLGPSAGMSIFNPEGRAAGGAPSHFGEVVLPIIDAMMGPLNKNRQRLLRYVPAAPYVSARNGVVPRIGEGPGVVFKEYPDADTGHNVLCHEYGHIKGLVHPEVSGTDQLPQHLTDSCNQPVPAYAGTNTEMASPASPADPIVMALDPLNLMGYWPVIADQTPLRRDQWMKLRE